MIRGSELVIPDSISPMIVGGLGFSGPKFVFAKFWEVLKNYLANNLILKVIWVRGWDKMAPSRVREGDAKLVK